MPTYFLVASCNQAHSVELSRGGRVQTVARDLVTAQGRLATASSELKQIAAQAEHESQELRQARMLIVQLQAQRSSAEDHDSEQLSMAQRDLRRAQDDLDQARQELSLLQTQMTASQQKAQQEQVTCFKVSEFLNLLW